MILRLCSNSHSYQTFSISSGSPHAPMYRLDKRCSRVFTLICWPKYKQTNHSINRLSDGLRKIRMSRVTCGFCLVRHSVDCSKKQHDVRCVCHGNYPRQRGAQHRHCVHFIMLIIIIIIIIIIFVTSAALSKIRRAAGTCHSVLTNRCAFRRRAKVAVDSVDRRSSAGKMFQVSGSKTAKFLRPMAVAVRWDRKSVV